MMFTKEDFFRTLLDIDKQLKEKRKGPSPESVLYLNEKQYKDFQKRGWIDENGNFILKINGKDTE